MRFARTGEGQIQRKNRGGKLSVPRTGDKNSGKNLGRAAKIGKMVSLRDPAPDDVPPLKACHLCGWKFNTHASNPTCLNCHIKKLKEGK